MDFVEGGRGGGEWGQFKTKKYTSIFVHPFNTYEYPSTPSHIATVVQSFGEGDSGLN